MTIICQCVAKFTSSNGSVFGSLILDIRKAGDYSQPLPIAVRIAYEGKKAFLRLGEKYTMEEWIQLCDYQKTGRRDDTTSIYQIWNEYLQEKTDSGKAGTARVGRDVRNRFVKDNGEHVEFSDIDSLFILGRE